MPYVGLIFPPLWLQLLMFFFSPVPFSGVNIGGAGSYVYDTPANNNPSSTGVDSATKAEEKRVFQPKAPSKGKWKNMSVYERGGGGGMLLYSIFSIKILVFSRSCRPKGKLLLTR